MEVLVFLGVIVCFVLIFVLFDRTGRLEYRIRQLEKQGTGQKPPLPAQTNPQAEPALAANKPAGEAVPFYDGCLPPDTSVKTARVTPSAKKPAPAQSAPAQTAAAPAEEPVFTFEPAEKTPSKFWAYWENFTTAKLFSWIGGFTLFLGVVFFIKYSVENDLISPAMRVLLGASFGCCLLAAGLFIQKKNLKVTADTLSGCGLAVLYAVVFSAHAFYNLIGANTTFLLMALVSLSSFAVAVWKHAKYVGFLAEIIAFLTPFLLSSGGDHTVFFFTYVAFVNAAAAAAALKRNWNGLLIGAAAFTALCQGAFMLSGVTAQNAGAFCLFAALYGAGAVFAAVWHKNRLSQNARQVLGFYLAANLIFVFAGVVYFGNGLANALQFLALGLWTNILLSFLMYTDRQLHAAAFLTGKTLVFLALLSWTQQLTNAALYPLEMGAFAAFAAVNAGADFLLYKKRGTQPGALAALFPAVLMLPLLFQITELGFAAFLYCTLVMAVLLSFSALFALLSGKPKTALFACALFILALLYCADGYTDWGGLTLDGSWALLLGLSLIPTLFTFGAVCFLRKSVPTDDAKANLTVFISALMPYILILAAGTRAGVSMHLVLGFTLLLNALCGFFVYLYKNGKPLLAALAGSALVQGAFYLARVAPADAPETAAAFMAWTTAIFAFFALYPFVFKKRFLNDICAWAACALAGIPAVWLIYATLKTYYQLANPGLLPLGFALLYLAGINAVYFWQPLKDGIQKTRLAWLGGAALFFVTLIFPLQFSKAWLTVSWALEGAALIYLNRYLPHKGLTRTGFWLLVLVFIRLVFNPAIADYYASTSKIFNWYLYAFGVCGAAMLLGARWWKPEAETGFIRRLQILGAITLFALLNIEIAHWFSAPGTLSFDVFGDFASAIAYTVGWTVFGGVLLLVGLGKKTNGAARAGTVLICVALLKLFASDIWALGGLYRVFGLFGVAIVLMLVSFAYQRFKHQA